MIRKSGKNIHITIFELQFLGKLILILIFIFSWTWIVFILYGSSNCQPKNYDATLKKNFFSNNLKIWSALNIQRWFIYSTEIFKHQLPTYVAMQMTRASWRRARKLINYYHYKYNKITKFPSNVRGAGDSRRKLNLARWSDPLWSTRDFNTNFNGATVLK